jgi:hypothetical protein
MSNEFQLKPSPPAGNIPDSDTWATPAWIVEWVRETAGWPAFDFDPACVPATAKAPDYICPDTGDGLWDPWRGSTVWLNPPYSKQALWLARAARECRLEGRRVAALVMPSFDAIYFRSTVWQEAAEIWMIEGRIAFEMDGEPRPGGNVRSCVVIYDPALSIGANGPRVKYLRPIPKGGE